MLQKIADAPIEPVSLEEAKKHLEVDVGSHDAYIASLITAARTTLEDRLQRTLIETTWRVTLDRFPAEIRLPMPPVAQVDELRYVASDGTPTVLNPAEYELDNTREPAWLVPAYNGEWPSTRLQINAVRVTYKAGYRIGGTNEERRAAVPMPIRQWILLAVGEMFENRERTTHSGAIRTLSFVDALVDPYRVATL